MPRFNMDRSCRIFVCSVLATLLALTPITNAGLFPHVTQAKAQQGINFHEPLDGYGRWVQHPHWGAVWIPDKIRQEWQPYREGHWVYTDEWGWYWDSDEVFGWITYHYGRWLFDRSLGWIWIPGEEWGPAWVNWRLGDDVVGWAPLPPDELIDDDENPDLYMFVRAGDLITPQVDAVILPPQQRFIYFSHSIVVNRSIMLGDRRLGINPGVPPAYVARASGRPFRSVAVTPIVIVGTVNVAGAIILHEGFHDHDRTQVNIRENNRMFQPNDRVLMPKGLARGEHGHLGNIPISAVRGSGMITPQLQKNFDGSKDLAGAATSPKNPGSRSNTQENQFRTQRNQRNAQKKSIERKDRSKLNIQQKN
jgi:hypothetical protein